MNANARCVICGCTDSRACAGGCSWLAVDRDERVGVCSSCSPTRSTAAVELRRYQLTREAKHA